MEGSPQNSYPVTTKKILKHAEEIFLAIQIRILLFLHFLWIWNGAPPKVEFLLCDYRKFPDAVGLPWACRGRALHFKNSSGILGILLEPGSP